MKLRHAAAFVLVVALGCLVPGCTRRPPSSTWHIVEAPRRTCVGPKDPWGRWPDYVHHRPDQCFDLNAPLSKWTKVKTPWLRTGWRIHPPPISGWRSIVVWPIFGWQSILGWRIYYPRADFESGEDCWNHLSVMITDRLPLPPGAELFGDVPAPPRQLMCISSDDPRLTKNKGPYEP